MTWLGNPELYKMKFGITVFEKVIYELDVFDLTYGGTWDIEKNRNNGNLNLPNGVIMNISVPIESFYLKEKDDDGIKVTLINVPVDIDDVVVDVNWDDDDNKATPAVVPIDTNDDNIVYEEKGFKMFKNSAELSGEIKRLANL
jgi:hypothetical protein